MDDKVIDITKHLVRRSFFKKPVSKEINFFLLEKLSEEIPEIKKYIKELIEFARNIRPGEVERVIKANSRDMDAGIGLEDKSYPDKIKEFSKAFQKSHYIREIILDEYFLVLKPLLAGLGGFDGDAVSAN